FPIPRPDLSAELGVPNACVDCHQGQDNQWAVESMRGWGVVPDATHWSLVHRRLRRGDPEALAAVKSLLEDGDLAPLVKANLLAQTANVGSTTLIDVLRPWIAHPDPLIRRGAVAGTMGLPGEVRWWMFANRLRESHPGVRFEMAIAVSDIYPGLSPAARRAAAPLLADYREALAASTDLAATQAASARLNVALGRTAPAERGFERALEIDPTSLVALVDFADLRRAQGLEQEAGTLLRRALTVAPDNGTANVAYGLYLVRLDRHDEALTPLSKAAQAPDAQPRFVHIYAVALDSLGQRERALTALREGIARWPWSVDLLTTLVLYIDDGRSAELRRHLDTLEALAPDSPQVRALRERYGANPEI
ncbi:MAG: tetratricopeptide repeat protein, partial [Gammaproteobacteria bacterium]|nr:tetratricopeptide repeat protein [Gammaproteobacteria bacterium]